MAMHPVVMQLRDCPAAFVVGSLASLLDLVLEVRPFLADQLLEALKSGPYAAIDLALMLLPSQIAQTQRASLLAVSRACAARPQWPAVPRADAAESAGAIGAPRRARHGRRPSTLRRSPSS